MLAIFRGSGLKTFRKGGGGVPTFRSIAFEGIIEIDIAKGTTDPRVEFISQGQIQILIKFYLKNLDQASTSKSQPNISLSIKLELQNLDQT